MLYGGGFSDRFQCQEININFPFVDALLDQSNWVWRHLKHG
jgi:hypothetical protein